MLREDQKCGMQIKPGIAIVKDEFNKNKITFYECMRLEMRKRLVKSNECCARHGLWIGSRRAEKCEENQTGWYSEKWSKCKKKENDPKEEVVPNWIYY